LAFKQAIFKAIQTDIDTSIQNDILSLEKVSGEIFSVSGFKRAYIEILYLYLFSYSLIINKKFVSSAFEFFKFIIDCTDKILRIRFSEETISEIMLGFNNRLGEYSQSIGEFTIFQADPSKAMNLGRVFAKNIFGPNHKENFLIDYQVFVLFGTHLKYTTKYFEDIQSISSKKK